jgi:hypothetical protein
MYMIITVIDQSYFINIIHKNDIKDAILVIINFVFTMIYQLTGNHLVIVAFERLVDFIFKKILNKNIINK